MTLGQRMRTARADAGHVDDAEFADRMDVGLATLRAWEADIQRPAEEELRRFAELTDTEPEVFIALDRGGAAQGICRAVDLVPEEHQAEALDQVGLPRALWDSPERWVAFLRLAQAAAELDAHQVSLLAGNAESCVIEHADDE